MNEDQINHGVQSGYTLVREAARLLCDISVSMGEVTTARGQLVHIVIDAVQSDDGMTYGMVITCYAMGWQPVPWRGVPIIMAPADNHAAPTFVVRLDERGQAILPAVPSGTYTLGIPACWYHTEQPIIEPQYVAMIRARGGHGSDAESDQYTDIDTHLVPNNAQIRVLTQRLYPDWLWLGFETSKPECAGKSLYFAIVNTAGVVVEQGTVVLEVKAGTEQVAAAQWECEFEEEGECHILLKMHQES